MNTQASRLQAVHGQLGGSTKHCWLMRRDLNQPSPAIFWPGQVRAEAFTLEFAAQAHRLLRLAYGDEANVPDFASWLENLQSDPECDPALCHTAWDDQGLVGFVHGWTSSFIKDLVVHPRARHQGVGLNLLSHAFDIFRQRNEAWVDLKVVENNFAARCLYEKAGMIYVQRQEIDPL